jgi:hypothetical protein
MLDFFFMVKVIPKRNRTADQAEANEEEKQALEDSRVVPSLEADVIVQTPVVGVFIAVFCHVRDILNATFDQNASNE